MKLQLSIVSLLLTGMLAAQPMTVKVLPEPQEPIKALNCGNIGPSLKNADEDFRNNWFGHMKLPYVRLHDIPFTNSALKIVDMHLIFANDHADASKRENYCFEPTDDYINQLVSYPGVKAYYRLGVSIENIKQKHYHIHPVKDVKKWADVASNIIRHYTEGKWDGFKHDIEYWEIWNEPDNHETYTGTMEDFTPFYIQVAKTLKKRFPHLKIGGPSLAHGEKHIYEPFILACEKAGAPIDFFSYHYYPQEWTTGPIIHTADSIRIFLDQHGYKDTEIHLNEWHPIKDWTTTDKRVLDGDGAALVVSMMLGFQDSHVDKAFYYTTNNHFNPNGWGVMNRGKINNSFYAMCAVGELYAHNTRLKIESSGLPEDTFALAGTDEDGNVCILASCYKTRPRALTFDLSSLGEFDHADIHILDNARKLDRIFTLRDTRCPFDVDVVEDSAVILIRLRK